MKITAFSALANSLCEAIKQFNKAKDIYEKAEHDFFDNNGDADAFRRAKQDRDVAMWSVIRLVIANEVFEELGEKKGIEV